MGQSDPGRQHQAGVEPVEIVLHIARFVSSLAFITGGSFYQLENTGGGHMILMGHRSGNQDTVMHIDYVTRQDLRKTSGPTICNRATDAEKPAGE